MADRLGPSDRDLERHLTQGLTHKEIADKYGVAKGTIASLASRAGLSGERLKYRTTKFWSPVHDRHQARHELNMLRARERQIKGEKVTSRELGRLSSFLDHLDATSTVVGYAPDTPEGFFFLDRDGVPADMIDTELPIVTRRLTLDAVVTMLQRATDA
jgi:hypothetical protein